MEATNKYGLSKKTNVAIAAIGAASMAKDSYQALIAITIIALTAISYQFILDRYERENNILN